MSYLGLGEGDSVNRFFFLNKQLKQKKAVRTPNEYKKLELDLIIDPFSLSLPCIILLEIFQITTWRC